MTEHHEELNDQLIARREKIEKMLAEGVQPFANGLQKNHL